MAYMNQERKKLIADRLKKVVPEGWKYSLSVRNHSTIVFTLRQAPVDILGHVAKSFDEVGSTNSFDPRKGYYQVNVYHIGHAFRGVLLKVFQDIFAAMNEGNHDKSDAMTDYFDVGWYVDINVGQWNDPFLDTVPAPKYAKKSAWDKVKAEKKKAKSKVSAGDKAVWLASGILPANFNNLTPIGKAWAVRKAMAMEAS